MSDSLNPSVALLVKLGSIAVHADEFFSPRGHSFNQAALQSLLQDAEVAAWLKEMDALAFLPKKR